MWQTTSVSTALVYRGKDPFTADDSLELAEASGPPIRSALTVASMKIGGAAAAPDSRCAGRAETNDEWKENDEDNLEPVPGDPTKFKVTNVPAVPSLLFDNNQPVIDWLHTLSEQAGLLLLRFQADFGEKATFTIERGGRRIRHGPGAGDAEGIPT